ncbi:MAG TPA: response regulator [Mucilaginibacter sp.]|nr:response regulator [Mucilaginibacter sp.]
MKKILIIEDDQDIVDLTVILLEREGYEVHSYTSFFGYESVVKECNPNLVLLDLNLRGYHGKDICKYIKHQDHLKQIKVILMSANPDIETVKEEVAADAFISKPFNIKEFLQKIKTNIN